MVPQLKKKKMEKEFIITDYQGQAIKNDCDISSHTNGNAKIKKNKNNQHGL